MRIFLAITASVLLTSFYLPAWAQPYEPVPSPDLSDYPEIIPSTTPKPIQSPSPTPFPVFTPLPSSTPTSGPLKLSLKVELPDFTEGVRSSLRISLENAASLPASAFPLEGEISYADLGYNQMPLSKQKIRFKIPASGVTQAELIFQSPGRKDLRVQLQYPGVAPRNLRVYSKPFPATVFPRETDSDFEKNPQDWHVWVNIYHSMSADAPQRQYYLITYKGEIVQRLLTSSAAPGKITPTGRFKLGPKIASPKSTLYESVMPFWTTILVPNFSFEYGNHGLVGESYLYLLGTPASHGCLRLSNKWVQKDGEWLNIGGAKWVFSHVPVGTPIEIFKKPVQPFVYENYQKWLVQKH
ncbi:hypothetical protein COW36_24400 [bacterium (Candidatus Blackallbacteria) CG17_big_fil_post_rev_8_21_14_2_50_48_46]|uniref:L,D-TPase catalytic domain-containing protein n=1 Tax=bacterium (Candidatus Blackallbacteria) CG17_big_fil_post_rev_8_21_14_2_50_48_46 TaxID=2014261 RepID=A0A2M7FX38_9BACT|nr:MAG: hypothetical protein COW64_19340 [bacterium (Candidatus Blackallbacteria) CG18_big_fil_WC_8_21_14_2_50_49_26]PIW13811.1 MAG: hypothetical protein COW36_24400 [bacterium (Candidatus Blackallbacteria) CG17_big_fil_post_rev_8_21_14_2_50_48_46]PIW45037.1 MAG: hypothetical protein COW20_22030 [bacterium (Candidatus Blackallbacteria) CG13_big_fil_rev_8_21_14_2_50_49_14]